MYIYISTNRDKFYQHDGFFDFFLAITIQNHL
jgi:hypothetical protein